MLLLSKINLVIIKKLPMQNKGRMRKINNFSCWWPTFYSFLYCEYYFCIVNVIIVNQALHIWTTYQRVKERKSTDMRCTHRLRQAKKDNSTIVLGITAHLHSQARYGVISWLNCFDQLKCVSSVSIQYHFVWISCVF